MKREPKTLQEAIIYFSNPDNCREYLIARRWPDGVTCPRCGSQKVTAQPKYNRWQCSSHHKALADKRRQFTLKTGTIFEDSPLGLDKWLMAMWMIVNCKNGVSSYEIHRAIGVMQKTAWFMDHRIRLALGMAPSAKLSGQVEVDETFIGGKARNMHRAGRARKIHGTGGSGKVAVMGLLERHGEVRTMVVPNVRRRALHGEVSNHVEQGSIVYSDAFRSYDRLQEEYIHNVINHAERYVDGHIHTNGIENFWCLLKRSLGGTYVSVEPFHLFRDPDEQSFRFNNRKLTDSDRFSIAASQIVGRRVRYSELTGKASDQGLLRLLAQQIATRKKETKMKTESEEAKNLDEFLSDISEIFEVPKKTLKKMIFQDEEESKIIQKGGFPYRADPTKRTCPTHGT